MQGQAATQDQMLKMLIDTGRIFSGGKNFTEIFLELMEQVRAITGAEGGSLYIYDSNSQTLKIVVITNAPLGISNVVETFNPLKISGFIEVPTHTDGRINSRVVSVCSFTEKRNILIPDLEKDAEFDFANTRRFDEANSYKTRNIVALPLTGHSQDVIGVLQLVNCNDSVFGKDMRPFIHAVTGQVGIMLSNALLVSETQELMSAVIQMIGVAIDEKSPHTAGHCQRVVILTMMIAEAMEKDTTLYKDFSLTSDQRRELKIAALLHDIGKIITPNHVLDKQTKLYILDDKINLLSERLRTWQLYRKLQYLEAALRKEGMAHLLEEAEQDAQQYDEEFEFLSKVNKGDIFMDEEAQKRLDELSARIIDTSYSHASKQLIGSAELSNLKIQRGTLNPQERKIMEDHVSISIRLLSSIPWPKNLTRVVEFAGAHHENMNGTGYPNKITGDQMDLPARILGIADRFEGLSAPDRPYRSTKMTLSRAMNIMEDMAAKEEIDREMFNFFKERKIHLDYAQRHLPAELIDC